MNYQSKHSGFKTVAISGVLLGGLFFAVAQPAQADEHARCRARIERAEINLDRAVSRHGEHSRQAEFRRRDLNSERERCWRESHGYWSSRDHRWHEERDWDRDRDRDRH